MAQFDVHRNPSAASRTRVPFLLDVQADLLSLLATRVVVPLCPPEVIGGKAAEKLNPLFEIEGRKLVMLTAELAGIPRTSLGARVASLRHARGEIVAALDVLLTGI